MEASAKKSVGFIEPGLSVLIATGIRLFHKPSQTSPNCPLPRRRINFKSRRSISHLSTRLCDNPSGSGLTIFNLLMKIKIDKRIYVDILTCTQGFLKFTHKPSDILE